MNHIVHTRDPRIEVRISISSDCCAFVKTHNYRTCRDSLECRLVKDGTDLEAYSIDDYIKENEEFDNVYFGNPMEMINGKLTEEELETFGTVYIKYALIDLIKQCMEERKKAKEIYGHLFWAKNEFDLLINEEKGIRSPFIFRRKKATFTTMP